MSHTNVTPTMGGMIEYAGQTQQLNRTEAPVTPGKTKRSETSGDAEEAPTTTITVQSQAVQSKVIYWVGGKPNDDWTQLKDPKVVPASPQCCRTVDPAVNLKTYERAVLGTETKFGCRLKDYHLSAFSEDVKEHLVLHGMDTIFYVKTASGLIDCLEQYKSITISGIKPDIKATVALYDPYDKENDTWAKKFLLNCQTA